MNSDQTTFKYHSYVQDILGPMCFDYGLALLDGYVHPEILMI